MIDHSAMTGMQYLPYTIFDTQLSPRRFDTNLVTNFLHNQAEVECDCMTMELIQLANRPLAASGKEMSVATTKQTSNICGEQWAY